MVSASAASPGRSAKRAKLYHSEDEDEDASAGSSDQRVGTSQEVEQDTALYGCTVCLEKFKTLFALRDHVRLNTQSHATSQDKDRPFKCLLCDRTYKNPNGLKYHISTAITDGRHTKIVPSRGRPSKAASEDLEAHLQANTVWPDDQPRETFNCPLVACEKQYKQLSGLRYHLVHGHARPLTYDELAAINPNLAERLNGRGDALQKAASKPVADKSGKAKTPVNLPAPLPPIDPLLLESNEDAVSSGESESALEAAQILQNVVHRSSFSGIER